MYPASTKWSGWNLTPSTTLNGNGTISVTSDGSSSQYAVFEMAACPGDDVMFSVMARNTGAEGPGGPAIAAGANTTTERARMFVTSSDWRLYRTRVVVDETGPSTGYIRFACGLFTGRTGSAQFHSPRFDVVKRRYAPLGTLAAGIITITDGVPAVNNRYKMVGIHGVARSATLNYRIEVTVDNVINTAAATGGVPGGYNGPLTFINSTARGATPIVAQPNFYSEGVSYIDFHNMTTGALVDIGTLAGEYDFQILLLA